MSSFYCQSKICRDSFFHLGNRIIVSQSCKSACLSSSFTQEIDIIYKWSLFSKLPFRELLDTITWGSAAVPIILCSPFHCIPQYDRTKAHSYAKISKIQNVTRALGMKSLLSQLSAIPQTSTWAQLMSFHTGITRNVCSNFVCSGTCNNSECMCFRTHTRFQFMNHYSALCNTFFS